MPIAKETGHTFEPVPAGTHIARCCAVISLGTQPQDNPQFRDMFKVMIQWEVPGELIEYNGEKKPMIISKEYTLSLGEKSNLRRDLEGWRGKQFTADELKGFDVAKVCGAPCMLSVVHKTTSGGRVYGAITSVSALPKGTVCPPSVHSPQVYEIEDGKDDTFQNLPEWVQKKIEQCVEWTRPVTEAEPEPEPEPEPDPTDIPF